MKLSRPKPVLWSVAPDDVDPVQRANFRNVQLDGVGVGFASAASPFLSVFLARLGASSFEVGLLTAMPAITGLFLAIAAGRFLQRRRNIVPWFSSMRFLNISAYALTGLAAFIASERGAVVPILVIWAVVTIPQTLVGVAFSLVMSNVAGPRLRYELMSRRWSVLELVTAVTVLATGQFLVRMPFPINYQIIFVVLSLGGVVSYYFSSRIRLPDNEPSDPQPGVSLRQRAVGFVELLRHQRPFVSLTAKRFVFFAGTALSVPLLPLYYVRELNASDGWIGIISTASTALMLVGYYYWTRQSRRRGPRFVLLCTTLGMALYPALTAVTRSVPLVAVYAGLAGIFGAGLDLVFFDELMKTVPPHESATFVAVAQTSQYLATALTPLLGSVLVDALGIGPGLILAGALRFASFVLFAFGREGGASAPPAS